MTSLSSCKFVAGQQHRLPRSWTTPVSGTQSTTPSSLASPTAPVRRVRLAPFASMSGPHAGFHIHSAGADAVAAEQLAHYAHDMRKLCGSWVKDKAVSDSMREAMDLVAISGMVRQAIKLIRGLQISQDDTTWSMAVVSVISWFKITERYPLSGEMTSGRRRDLRRGGCTGRLLPNKPGPHGGLLLNLQWGEPHAGTGADEFVLAPRGTAAAQKAAATAQTAAPAGSTTPPSSPVAAPPAVSPVSGSGEEELHVYSTIDVGGKRVSYRQVYHRK